MRLARADLGEAEVERDSGERLRLDLRRGCSVELPGRVGRTVLIWSPDSAISISSRLLVPEMDATCPIWKVDTLGKGRPRPAAVAPVEGLAAMRRTLELLGYDCGPLGGSDWTPEARQAFDRFREGKRLDDSQQGLRRAVTSLALDGMRGRQASGTSLRLARIISDQLDALTEYLSRPGGAAEPCGLRTWIRRVAEDGSLVSLADGTSWQPLTDARAVAARWQSGDDVVICSGRLVDVRTGEMARAVKP